MPIKDTLRRSSGLAAGVILVLAGCAAGPAPQPDAEAPAQSSSGTPSIQSADFIYAAIVNEQVRHDTAQAAVMDGDLEQLAVLQDASRRIVRLQYDCESEPLCDGERVAAVASQVLASQLTLVAWQADRLAQLQIANDELEREPGTISFVGDLPEATRSVNLLKGTDLAEVISLNGPVKAAMDDWLTWNRPLLMTSYENYQFMRSKMAPSYEAAGLPEALLFAMLATESGGRVHSFSRAGAAGPLQFMRATGRRYGLRTVEGFDQRLDPAAATRANVAYLNDHFAIFNENLEKALAAYNGGENRLKRLNRRMKSKSFWDSEFYYSLPRETREYVPRVLAAAYLFLHPEEYNLQFPTIQQDLTLLELKRDASLGELTVCLGQSGNPNGWFRTLRNLNPQLQPSERVEAGQAIEVPQALVETYAEQCLEGELLASAAELHDANYPDGSGLIPYRVQRGDTLGKIASRHRCVSTKELAAINNIRAPRYMIRLGQMLSVPQC